VRTGPYDACMDTLFTVLHVVGAVFIVGPMAILPQTGLRALRAGDAGAVRTIAKSTRIFSIISVVVALLGFALVGMADPKYHLSILTPWLLVAIIAYVIALVLSLALVVPALRRAGEGLSASAPAPAGLYRRVAIGSGVSSLLLLVVVVLMVWRP
jgi:uncharacterized membrane protein